MTIKNTVNIKVAFFSTIQSSLASFDRNWCVFNIIQERKKKLWQRRQPWAFFSRDWKFVAWIFVADAKGVRLRWNFEGRFVWRGRKTVSVARIVCWGWMLVACSGMVGALKCIFWLARSFSAFVNWTDGCSFDLRFFWLFFVFVVGIVSLAISFWLRFFFFLLAHFRHKSVQHFVLLFCQLMNYLIATYETFLLVIILFQGFGNIN